MDSHVPTASPAARGDYGTCHVAIELSGAGWLVGIHTPLSDKIGVHKLAAGDASGLVALIARVRAKVERGLGGPVDVVSCYEAGYDGFWLHRFLVAEGIANKVIDPASLPVDRRARRAKTDRIDVTTMTRSLMADARGEHRVFSVVRVPRVDEEDAKRGHRERYRLIKERVAHANRIKGLLALHGIYGFRPLRRDRQARLEALRGWDGRPLPAAAKGEIERELTRLALVVEMVAEVEADRNAVVRAESAAGGSDADKIRDLHRLKGIGPEIATRLVREAFYRDFDNRRQLASYVGLCPSPFSSGPQFVAINGAREQGISKAGNAMVRTTMIELAWLWLRHQPDSALSRWFVGRVGELKGRARRITIVALARKLLVALWRFVETGLVPEGAVLRG